MDSSEAPPPTTTPKLAKQLPHPPYTKMIVAAIGALNEKTGSSKTAIAKFIDSSYSSLAQNRSVLLARNLKRLKTKEIICMVKHSYKLSSTATADGGVKRGRGRGRPRKSAVGGGGVKRGRGRPPKVAKPKPVGSGLVKRGRGRPPSKPKLIIVAAAPPSAVVPAIVVKRGRPPKVKSNPNPNPNPEGGEVVPPIVVPVGRPRGRPAKAGGGVPKPKIGSSTGRPRGRPKKGAAADASTPTPVPIEE